MTKLTFIDACCYDLLLVEWNLYLKPLATSLSALDTSSEASVQETLNELQNGKSHTTLIIGHVFPNIKRADEIVIVSDGGSIVDKGTHAEVFMQCPV